GLGSATPTTGSIRPPSWRASSRPRSCPSQIRRSSIPSQPGRRRSTPHVRKSCAAFAQPGGGTLRPAGATNRAAAPAAGLGPAESSGVNSLRRLVPPTRIAGGAVGDRVEVERQEPRDEDGPLSAVEEPAEEVGHLGRRRYRRVRGARSEEGRGGEGGGGGGVGG